MLADKQKRVKYSINPRGNAWSNDEDKFGQKMLEKFGWEKGKGLGMREDGRSEHVKISNKNDTKGLGFKKTFSDNLISHQDDFNSLLSSLSETHTSVSHAATDDVSKLAEKSGSAKKRVHYHKHVKSKDLSGRTAEDIDCIFGRRKTKTKKHETELMSLSSFSLEAADLDATANVAVDSESAVKQVKDKEHGVLTINTGKSVSEYFALKMSEVMKGTNKQTNTEPAQKELLITGSKNLDCAMESEYSPKEVTIDQSDCFMDVDHCPEKAVKKKSKKKKKKKKLQEEEFVEEKSSELTMVVDSGYNYESVSNYNNEPIETSESINVRHKKTKDKANKCKEMVADIVGCDNKNDVNYVEIPCKTSSEAKMKKSKKKKKKVPESAMVDSENVVHNPEEQSTMHLNSEEPSTKLLNLETEKDAEVRDENFDTKRKKKKKKRSREEDSLCAGMSDTNPTEECTAPKGRKNKEQVEKDCNILDENVNEEKSSTHPDTSLHSHYTFRNLSTKGTQPEFFMIPMYKKDIKDNSEAMQSALESFQTLGANVLDIIGYSF